MKTLLFGLVVLVLSPLLLLGMICYVFRLLVYQRRQHISGTAYEPLMGRLLFHLADQRDDSAANALAPHLPALSPAIWFLISFPILGAYRLSGHMPDLLSYPGPRPASLMSSMGIRTAFFDQTLRESLGTVRQVVILGAGWDTRAYGLLRDWKHPVFEVDTQSTQQAKLAALKDAEIDASQVTFVAVDFNRQSWFEMLQVHGFDPSLPTYFLWEGVTMYLEEQAIVDTLTAVAAMPQGSVIGFDYFARELVDGEGVLGLVGKLAAFSITLFYGEPFLFGFPTKPAAREKMAAVLEEHGLQLEDFEQIGREDSGETALYAFALAGPAG